MHAYSRKGHLQFFMKEYEKAGETYEAGLVHDPDNAELKDGIARCMEAVNKVRSHSWHLIPLSLKDHKRRILPWHVCGKRSECRSSGPVPVLCVEPAKH